MFTLKPTHIALAALLSGAAFPAYAQEQDTGFGVPATVEDIAAIDIDIMPDGTGLPAGSGSYAQGQEVYEMTCAACHGEDMEGVKELGAPALIGGRGSLTTDAPMKTIESYWPYASTAFDYIRRAMPMNAPGSLSDDEVYAVTAYILGKANIISEETTLDAESFKLIEMPNQDGFVEDPRPGSY
jgi:cytochrome c